MTLDRHGRPHRSLRISVTDRCNFRCRYCMPEEEYAWLPRSSLLTFEELERLARVFVSEGVTALRLTGGEPLLRRHLPELVRRLAAIPGVADLALTTNGTLLGGAAPALSAAGLHRVTVSLDTLRPERAEAFARTRLHPQVLAGIRAAGAAGLRPLKLNTVVVRGFNEDELGDLVTFGREVGAEVRFIEYMDVGGATAWTMDQVVPRDEIVARVAREHGTAAPSPDPADPSAPAERFVLPDGTTFGVIASVTVPFCGRCDRSRLTADGTWFTCLYAADGEDLREPLRAGASDAALREVLARGWAARSDRGAEVRLGERHRGALYPLEALRRDPHKEMHTRGG
ncbi:MAG TPA: GTP 3',8-cyclase MoaA [Gemmatimonadales bacterium]|nr:GTP 3',8-cyclase MoaA [Gemmatimonadales bacterium]